MAAPAASVADRFRNDVEQQLALLACQPNGPALWMRAPDDATAIARALWRSGALAGTESDDAFFVRCDHTTMTQDDIDNGRLILLVGIAPTKPAEFETIRIEQQQQRRGWPFRFLPGRRRATGLAGKRAGRSVWVVLFGRRDYAQQTWISSAAAGRNRIDGRIDGRICVISQVQQAARCGHSATPSDA
jgi:hypothetical protein